MRHYELQGGGEIHRHNLGGRTMTPPVHQWKVYMRFPDEEKPSWSYEGRCCWLGSGVVDRNGVEIYEGDIIEIDMTPNQPLPIFYHSKVVFEKGVFNLGGKLLNEFSPSQLEVVSHIAEDG